MDFPGLTKLAGKSYVLDTTAIRSKRIGDIDWVLLAGRDHGGDELSQWLASSSADSNTPYGFGNSDVVLFVIQGSGAINIAGCEFPFSANSGIYIAPGETFSIPLIESGPLRLLVGVCPENVSAPQLDGMSAPFDNAIPTRIIPLAEQQQHATADRFYQLLVNEQLGNCRVTQFIGSIPRSKAPPHFHEYEEIITVLSGSGLFWTENISAPISSGSVIYLPRKQPHCIECTDDAGMQLVGMFYPAGSPAVRY